MLFFLTCYICWKVWLSIHLVAVEKWFAFRAFPHIKKLVSQTASRFSGCCEFCKFAGAWWRSTGAQPQFWLRFIHTPVVLWLEQNQGFFLVFPQAEQETFDLMDNRTEFLHRSHTGRCEKLWSSSWVSTGQCWIKSCWSIYEASSTGKLSRKDPDDLTPKVYSIVW